MMSYSSLLILNPPSPLHLQTHRYSFRSHSTRNKTSCPIPSSSPGIKPPQFLGLHPQSSISSATQKLKQLIESRKLEEARELYNDIKVNRFHPGVVLESMLIDMFMKSGRVSDAFQVFEGMPQRNVVTWTSMISGCVRNGCQRIGFDLFIEMLELDVVPNDFAFSAALQACADLASLRLGVQLHSLIIRFGLESDCRIGCCLIDFYSRCGSMDKAAVIFDGMAEKDLVSFTSVISGFCRNGAFDSAVGMFGQMVRKGLEPNEHTVTSILTACGPLLGEQIHGYMIKSMIDQSVYSASALLEFYSRNCKFRQAKAVFDKLEAKNVVTWSSLISSYLRNEQVEEALKLFCEMVTVGLNPNEFTFSAAIGACGLCLEFIKMGRQLHCSVIKLNLASDNHVSNALITMYARNGETDDLEKVFKRIKDHDVISWCAAISGFFLNEFYERSMGLFCEMHKKGYMPNEYGFSSALSSCASLALLDHGRQFHCLALKSGCDVDVCTGNALINMYAKCGHLDEASLAFDEMCTHDVMSWNSLIHGYANHGHGKKALKLFNDMMELKQFVPDGSTFVAILVGCSHVGCIGEAIKYFEVMRAHYGIVPSASHYACMIDMMGRAGRLSESLQIIKGMPFEPDALIWKTLLGSCRLHRNIGLGKIAAKRVNELSPKDSASYVLLSNLHAMHGEWDDAEGVRRMMEARGVKKDAGWSWIEIRSEIHSFVASDKSHPKSETIYRSLEELYKGMQAEGHSLDINLRPNMTLGDGQQSKGTCA